MTKGFVELHGGTIRLDSEVERGTCVTISLPKGRTDENALNLPRNGHGGDADCRTAFALSSTDIAWRVVPGPMFNSVAEWPMLRNTMSSFEAVNRSAMSSRDAAAAWVIVILLLAASMVGFILDRAATITPVTFPAGRFTGSVLRSPRFIAGRDRSIGACRERLRMGDAKAGIPALSLQIL